MGAHTALAVLATGAVLGMLYLGRSILVPVTLATVLSFAISPLVRILRRLGLGQVFSVLGAVIAIAVAIVLATLFWGWLWGPAGVIIATPLTLCLAVAGRHAGSLGYLDILLGDGPALTMAQKFYQRALTGDSVEIVAGARAFLKRRSFAAYCDTVLVPALQLGLADFASGDIAVHQQAELRGAIVRVVEALDGAARGRMSRQHSTTVLEKGSSGQVLREKRLRRQRTEAAHASANGSVRATPESLVLCIALGAQGDDLAAELFVRILRGLNVDARHLTLEDLRAPRAPEAHLPAIGAVCIVSMTPGIRREEGSQLARRIRSRLPQTYLLALSLPGVPAEAGHSTLDDCVDRIAGSFEDASLDFRAGHPRRPPSHPA